MALAIRQAVPAGDSLKRYAKSQVVELEKVLSAASEKGHGGVHKARRRLKSLRSFLRMLRPAIGDEAFREANAALRTAGHALAGARKAGAMIEAVGKLAKATEKTADAERKDLLAKLAEAAQADAATHAEEATVASGVGVAIDQVRIVKARLPDWKLPKRELGFYVKGMQKSYKRAQKLLEDGLAQRDAVTLHEARKSVIHLRYNLTTIEPVWPALFRAWSKELQTLREVLGDINDLHDLEVLLGTDASAFSKIEAKAKALALLEERRGQLIEAVHPLQMRLFSEPASNFGARIGSLWESWAGGETSS